MNKGDYLSELYRHLAPMPRDERDSAMRFYMEYFDDAGTENEQAVMQQLGTPRQLAEQLLGEIGLSISENGTEGDAPAPKARRRITPWMWVLIVLASPLLVTFGAVAFGLMVALLSVALMLVLCVLVVAFVPLLVSAMFVLAGVFAVGNGLLVALQHFPTALFFVGAGLFCAAGGALLFRPSVRALQVAARASFRSSGWLIRKFRWLRIRENTAKGV